MLDDTYYLPTFLPSGYKQALKCPGGAAYDAPKKITIIVTTSREQDSNVWLHVSVAHPSRLPTYDELKEIKEIFIGKEKDAIQVFPKESKHVNIHKYCLHLWHCLSRPDILPDFTRGQSIL